MDSKPPTGIRMLSRFGACVTCRKRKLRCDATQPECNRCRTTGHTCQYQNSEYRSKTKTLQDRIKTIEAKIHEIEQQQGRSVPSSASSSSVSTPDSNTLSEQTIPQAAVCHNDFSQQAPDPCSCLPLGASCFEPNMLLRRGPSGLSLPGDASRKLLNMFLQRKLLSGFELHIGRVVKSFQHGSSEPAVPALFNAMLLLGCHFISEPELQFWENMFYERTKLEIEANIARAHSNDRSKYNPLYHLQAMVMLGQWFYLKGRLLEGYVYATRATRLAVALGLHELDSRIYDHYVGTNQGSSRTVVERWRPRDSIELGEAINLWWACLIRDLGGTALNGLPLSISMEEIKTVWPVELSDFEDVGSSKLRNDNYSVASLFDPNVVHIVTDVSRDTANCMVAKSSVLTYCVGYLDTERISGLEVTDEWWARFEKCDRGIRSFTRSARKAYGGRNIEEFVNVALAHAVIDCAAIQLHEPLADFEIDGGTQCEACRSMALTTTYVQGVNTSYMQMFFGIAWSSAASVLAKYIPRLHLSGYTEQAREMEEQLILMAKCMERLLLTYPILAFQAEHLRELLRGVLRQLTQSET
ncbi:hypothetical protein OPQ81_006275 [Rhizoctonia solani]|nr:hypothetical protein OPQ81_006275 [Rhizoctonia solani]